MEESALELEYTDPIPAVVNSLTNLKKLILEEDRQRSVAWRYIDGYLEAVMRHEYFDITH